MQSTRVVDVVASIAIAVVCVSSSAFAGDPLYDVSSRRILETDHLVSDEVFERSVVDDVRRMASVSELLGADTNYASGAVEVGITSYDLQHNSTQGHQIGTNPGSNTVHMVWTYWDIVPTTVDSRDRFVRYNSWDKGLGEFNQGFDGEQISLGDFARAGFPRVDVDSDNLAHVTFHQFPDPGITDYRTWHVFLPIEGDALNVPERIVNDSLLNLLNPGLDDLLWSDIAVSADGRDPDNNYIRDVYHVISIGASYYGIMDIIVYSRFDTDTSLTGGAWPSWNDPVIIDSSVTLDYVIDAADGLDKVSVVLSQNYDPAHNGVLNVVYRESVTGGLGWINGSELGDGFRVPVTNYTDPAGSSLWGFNSCAYDHNGVFHVVWCEQRESGSEDIAIRHWNDSRGTIRTVALGYYDNDNNFPGYLNLNGVTLGIGDGATFCNDAGSSNEDFLYVLYDKACGETPEEQADVSALGICNGELYLTASTDGGNTWSPPQNLTDTKSPDCDGTDPNNLCAAEQWATIGRDVSDIEIFYIHDFQAGGFPTTGWVINRAMYMNLPGGTTDAQFVCPRIAPNLATALSFDPECEYYALTGDLNSEMLTIGNTGNAPLIGDISVTAGNAWLSTLPSGAIVVFQSDPGIEVIVDMDASALAEGLFIGEIQLTHNDTTQITPILYPIEFFVADEFFCPEAQILKTAVASPGVLSLQVGSNGRFGGPDAEGGLWRSLDSSSSIFDASLIVAHGSQSPDTVVFHRFGNNMSDPGQYGLRSLSDLVVDSFAYGIGSGYAQATAEMTTADSLIGITADWFFPQHPDSANFVIARYTIRNRTSEPGYTPDTINDIAVGLWADLNVVEAVHQNFQRNVDNDGFYWPDSNFVYQYGRDTAGHVPATHYESSQRYSCGITYILGRDANGADFAFKAVPIRAGLLNNALNQPGGGPTSGTLYSKLVGGSGVTIFLQFIDPDSSSDMFTHLTLDQGLTLAPGGTQTYIVGLVSDTLEHFDYGPAPLKGVNEDGLRGAVRRAWAWAENHLGCICLCHADPLCDGVTDVFDVLGAVAVAFQNGNPLFDVQCPRERTDVTCNGFTDVFDVLAFVAVAFQDGDPAVEFCNPCVP